MDIRGTSLAVQWLGLYAFTAVGTGSIPGQGTKIPQAISLTARRRKKKEKRTLGKGLRKSTQSADSIASLVVTTYHTDLKR